MSTKEVNMYYFSQVIGRLFTHRATYNEHGFELTFENLVTVDDWWSFIQTTFTENIAQLGAQAEMKNEVLTLLDLPRLRQIRVRNETCTIHEAFRDQFRTCFGKYSNQNEDVSGFLNKTHLKQNDIESYTVWGRIASYHGCGYIETLSLQADENKEVLEHLKASNWIDRATRAILVEFTAFNANSNLFCNVKLMAEFAPSGGILTSSEIHPLRYSVLCNGYLECICAVIFYGLILYYTFKITISIIVTGFFPFFYSMWNILDIIVVLLGYVSLVYAFWHTKHLRSVLDSYTLEKDQYFSLDVICYWNMFFTFAMGVCVFIVWIKFLKYIKLNKTMLQFSATIKRCAEDVLGFAVMFAIVFVAYADLSVLLFGTIHADFRDFPTAILTMLRMVLGDFNYEEMEEANKTLGPIYFLSYILFVFFILLNMFLAIINDAYSEVKAVVTHGKSNHFEEYLKSFLKKLKSTRMSNKRNAAKDFNEPSVSSRQIKEENDSTKFQTTDEDILDSRFEITSIPRTLEEQDALNQRIAMLEQTLEKLVEYLDKIQTNLP